MKKRIFSLLLVVCMVLTIIPLSVFTAEGEAPGDQGISAQGLSGIPAGTDIDLAVDKSDIPYGESVTLTATVTKSPADAPGTLVGSVKFKKDDIEIGSVDIDANGKATLTLDKTTLQASIDEYRFTARFISGNGAYNDSSDATKVPVIVKKKPLTITAKLDTYQFKDLPALGDALTYTGFVEGEGMYITPKTLTANYTAGYASGVDTETPGGKAIQMDVTGTEDNTNYDITLTSGTLTVHPAEIIQLVTALPKKPIDKPVIIAEPRNTGWQLRGILASLMPTAQEAATGWLKQEVTDATQMKLYELELQVSRDAGATWQKATVEDVKGKTIQVALPVLDGTNPTTNNFLFYHLRYGLHDGGPSLSFTYDEASKSIYATVDSFSPYAIVATPKSPGGNDNSGGPSGNNDEEYAFWMAVKAKIEKANKGDVLKVDAQHYDKMPVSVMEALRQNPSVTLIISWKGGQPIIIPAGKAQKPEAGRIYYPLSLLAELYKDVQFVEAPAGGGFVNPETGGPGYHSYADGNSPHRRQPPCGGCPGGTAEHGWPHGQRAQGFPNLSKRCWRVG